ncbi:MAG: hypothetical protein ACQESC_02450 [Nanobdellota archaeon]
MTSKQINISSETFKQLGEQIKQYFQKAKQWINNFWKTKTLYETIALGCMALGIILIITGTII